MLESQCFILELKGNCCAMFVIHVRRQKLEKTHLCVCHNDAKSGAGHEPCKKICGASYERDKTFFRKSGGAATLSTAILTKLVDKR